MFSNLISVFWLKKEIKAAAVAASFSINNAKYSRRGRATA
jgi:hypothetical protein